jgi:hypothetical protein
MLWCSQNVFTQENAALGLKMTEGGDVEALVAVIAKDLGLVAEQDLDAKGWRVVRLGPRRR